MKSQEMIKPRRVCMVVHQNYFTDARVRRYAETLANKGCLVDIICIAAAGKVDAKPLENITVHPIPLGKNYHSQMNFVLGYMLAFFFYFWKVSSLHLKHRYDIIHVHNMPDFLVFAAIIPAIMKTPVILDIHDIMPEFYMSKFSKKENHPVVRAIRFQEKLSTSFASSVITVCRSLQQILQKRGVKKEGILVIYNTPNTILFNRKNFAEIQSRPRKHFTLIFPGTQAPRYGLDIPIRALPLLIPKIPNIRLQIIGRQVEYTQELAYLAREIGVEQYVEFIPAVPVDKIPVLLAAADVGIYPAIKDLYMDIAIPEKVFEYTLMGLPVIATRLSALEEMFSDQAILYFESGQIEQFADCVIKLHQNSDLSKSMIHQADLEYGNEFSWEKEEKEYLLLLEKLIRK